ncbi:hypothetical protein L9F63_014071, partial [Diploptera punctata]
NINNRIRTAGIEDRDTTDLAIATDIRDVSIYGIPTIDVIRIWVPGRFDAPDCSGSGFDVYTSRVARKAPCSTAVQRAN